MAKMPRKEHQRPVTVLHSSPAFRFYEIQVSERMTSVFRLLASQIDTA